MNEALVSKPIHRAVKYRAFPKGQVEENIEKHFRATQEIFNVLLAANNDHWKKYHRSMNDYALLSLASDEAKKYPTLNRQAAYYVGPRIIYGTKRAKSQGEGELKPKEVGSMKASFTVRCTKPVFKEINASKCKKRATISIPRIGDLVIVPHRPLPENAICRLCTISRNASGQYFFSIDYDLVLPPKPPAPIKNPLGLDFSVPKLYVASDRSLTPDLALLKIRKQYAQKVAAAHRRLSKCKEGSKNYAKAKRKLAKLYQRMDNIRWDYIQKETSRIVANYDFIGVETLSLKDMCERFRFYKAVRDDSWYTFVTTLRYKAESAQKQMRFVSRFYPSSKTCHRCGYINHNLMLSDREYVCPVCHTRIDRDYNAAKNIRDKALRDAGYRINYIRVRPTNQPAAPVKAGSTTVVSIPSSFENPKDCTPESAPSTPPLSRPQSIQAEKKAPLGVNGAKVKSANMDYGQKTDAQSVDSTSDTLPRTSGHPPEQMDNRIKSHKR